jgi:hypothetical protein
VLTLRVGISGHRPKPGKLTPGAFPMLRRRLREVFDTVDAALVAAKRANAAFYADEPGAPPHRVRLVSGLAEGSDQLAIAARPSTWALDAILPFPLESYRRDFRASAVDRKTDVTADFEAALAQARTVVQLPEDPRVARGAVTPEIDSKLYWELRDEGYSRLGEFLLGQVDILVAVWDGLPAEGPGGTAEVVHAAVRQGIPVVWVAAGEDVAPALVERFDSERRAIRREGALAALLQDAILTIVSVPTEAAHHATHGPSTVDRLKAFLGESWPRPTRAVTYDIFRRLTRFRWARRKDFSLRLVIPPEDIETSYRQPWRAFIADAADAGDLNSRITATLLPRYMWADALAVERSHWYRAAYFNCYLLAAVTVFVALLGSLTYDIFDRAEAMLIYKAGLVMVELALISIIIRIVMRGTRARWQQRWVEYRALAEMLRSTRMLAYLGLYGGVQRAGHLEPEKSGWFLWYVRSTIRELGMPNAVLDESYLRRQLTTVDRHVIDDQLSYHVPNVATAENMQRWIRWLRNGSFIATAAVLAAFLAGYAVLIVAMLAHGHSLAAIVGWYESHIVHHHLAEAHGFADTLGVVLYRGKTFVTFAAAFLPAIGAAFAGIQETGDFEGLALSSDKTAKALQAIKRRIGEIIEHPTLETTGAVFLSTTEVLTEDLGAWQSIYGRKHLGLP